MFFFCVQKIAAISHSAVRIDEMNMVFFLGLTLQQSTDVKTLTKELEKLERQLRELNISQRTRYSSRDFQIHLKRQMEEKVLVFACVFE